MAAAAHNPAFAKKVGISQKVATEFNRADKGKKFGGGGMAKCKKYEGGGLTFADMSDEDRAAMAKARIAEMGGPMPETPVRKAKPVNKGDTRENLRDLDMQGADTGYDTTERFRNARKTGTRHYAGVPGQSAEPQIVTPKRKSALPADQKGMGSYKKGGTVRGCGCAVKGKTKGTIR